MEQQCVTLQEYIDERNALYPLWNEARKALFRNSRKRETAPQQYAILKAREAGLLEHLEMAERTISAIASEWELRLCRTCVSGMYIYGTRNATTEETSQMVEQH